MARSIWGKFDVGGIPRNGATVKLWSAGAFTSDPQFNDAVPSGSPLDTTTTSGSHGCDGAYSFLLAASGSYYVSIAWNGLTTYQYHRVDDSTGRGETLATNYANLQLAINATPVNTTLYIPPGTYTISGSDYVWTHWDGTSVTGLCVNKSINIIGAGRATKIQAGANSVALITYYNVTGSSDNTNPAYTSVSNCYLTANSFTGVSGVVYDQARRQRLRDNRIDGCHTNVLIKGAWLIDIEDNYLLGGANTTYGIRAMPFNGNNPTTIFVKGGEIVSGTVGILFQLVSMGGTINTTLELCSSGGVVVSGSNRITIDGSYFENLSPAYDVIVNGFSDNVRVDNVERLQLLDCNKIEVNQFRDKSTSAFAVTHNSQGVREVILNNTWWDETSGNTASGRDILLEVERGIAKVPNSGRPWLNVQPASDYVGSALCNNPDMRGSGANHSFSNMAVTGITDLPYLFTSGAYTTSAVAATTCTAHVTPDVSSGAAMQSRLVTISAWVKIPGTTWSGWLELRDADTNESLVIPNSFKDNAWHLIYGTFQMGSGATTLNPRVRFLVGSGGGVAYCTGIQLTLGTIPVSAFVSVLNGPRLAVEQPRYVSGTAASPVTLASGSVIDASAASYFRVVGSGPVTVSGQATFVMNNPRDGMLVTLIGTSASNTVTLTNGSTQSLRLGAATRVLGLWSAITLQYESNSGNWIELTYKA